MLAFNHITGGIAVTGVAMTFSNINLYSKPEYIILTVFASLLPDIDHTRSILGKVFYPLSKWLSIHYGHRTITHSIFILASVTACIWWASPTHAQIFGTAYGSHILFDLVTKQGVQLFSPFSKVIAVLPANPKFRISTHDYKTEFAILFVFIAMIFFSGDLVAKGFSSYYNTTLKTFRHLNEESKKGKVLEIEYVQATSRKANALVIETTESEAIITQNDSIFKIKKSEATIKTIKNTGLTPRIFDVVATKISLDSLNNLLKINKLILELEINSNLDFIYPENGLENSGKSVKMKLVSKGLFLKAIPNTLPNNNLKIKELQLRIAKINEEKKRGDHEKNALFLLKSKLENQDFADYYEREKATKKIQELDRKIESFKEFDNTEIQLLSLELNELLSQKPEQQYFDIYLKSWTTNF